MGRNTHSSACQCSLLAALCLLTRRDTDEQVGSRVEAKLNTCVCKAQDSIRALPMIWEHSRGDTSSELVKQPPQVLVKPVSLSSLLLGPKETGIAEGSASLGKHFPRQPVAVFRYSWKERHYPNGFAEDLQRCQLTQLQPPRPAHAKGTGRKGQSTKLCLW